MMQRLTTWMRINPWSTVAACLVVVHTGVVALYLTGSAISSVPFTTQAVEAVLSSPVVPVSHFVVALLLALAVTTPAARDIAAPLSFGVWLGTVASLYFLAQARTPPLAMWGAMLAAGMALFALVLSLSWDRGDDHEAA